MKRSLLLLSAILCSTFSFAQISSPPSGGNQKSVVTQYMGLTHVTITYNSPDVTASNGKSRKGYIWGKLVPYGMANLGFGESTKENPSPWRAGANENTTIEFSHDMQVEGQEIKAGIYGLHMIPGEEEWTLILSNNSTSWGSYFYYPEEDALRVTVKSEPNEYNEWLTYEFDERKLDRCVASLEWEELKVSFEIEVPRINEYYIAEIEDELRGSAGFNYQSFVSAANFAVANEIALDKALEWSNKAIEDPFVGQKNYTTLSTKASVLNALGRDEEAMEMIKEAINDPTANIFQIHQTGRALIARGEKEKALKVFKWNAERFPDTWPINVGLARGYSANGKYEKALKYAEMALKKAPDEVNRKNLTSAIEKLKNSEDIN